MKHFNEFRLPAGPRAALYLAAVLSACGGGKIPPTSYYVLDLPAAPRPAQTALPATAALMPIESPRMLQQDRIVYRESPQQVGFYEYHRWAEDPRELVAAALREQIEGNGTFRSVVGYDGRTASDYILRGRIERLEEVDYGGGVTAHAELSLTLIEAESREILWQGSASDHGAVSTPEVKEVVTRLSEATQASVKKIAAELDQFVRENLTSAPR